MSETYRAIVVDKVDGKDRAEIRNLAASDLPAGDVGIRVAYSDLNFKDGLALTGGRIVRSYPMVAGIDLAGIVEASGSPEFAVGDSVVVTGWGQSETQWGGYAQLTRKQAKHVLKLPSGLDAKRAMAIGTAGLTAMLSVLALEEQGVKLGGEVVVTGAAGGVGSVAVALAAHAGYKVVASTGRAELEDYLRSLGASEIIGREVLAAPSDRPLDSARWAGAIDSVGGDTLAGILRSTTPGGTVAACGLAGGHALNTTVMPFILRGVKLVGIDSNFCPNDRRRAAWDRLATDLSADQLDAMTRVVTLQEAIELAPAIIRGKVQGRTVIDVNG